MENKQQTGCFALAAAATVTISAAQASLHHSSGFGRQ
jgi:hypothetical protein